MIDLFIYGLIHGLIGTLCGYDVRFLETSDHSRWTADPNTDPDLGPDAELIFWRRRLQKLSAITEQVRSPLLT